MAEIMAEENLFIVEKNMLQKTAVMLMKRLRELHDQIETHYHGLEALDVDQITYSTIVFPMLLEKIPDGVKLKRKRHGLGEKRYHLLRARYL